MAIDELKAFMLDAIKTVGFPIVVAGALFWFCYDTIRWERDQMMPTIRDNTNAMAEVREAVEALAEHLPPKDEDDAK